MKPVLFSAVAFLLVLSVTSCSTFQGTVPETSITNLRFENVTLLETTAVFTVRIKNENNFPLVLDGSVHKISLSGVEIGTGLYNKPKEVERLSTVTFDVPVNISNTKLILGTGKAIVGRNVQYQMNTTLHLKNVDGQASSVETESHGSFELPEQEFDRIKPFIRKPRKPCGVCD